VFPSQIDKIDKIPVVSNQKINPEKSRSNFQSRSQSRYRADPEVMNKFRSRTEVKMSIPLGYNIHGQEYDKYDVHK
jgi:hypothetical protein